MRALMVLVAGAAILAVAGSAHAATKKKHQPVVLRSASGTVIQPTRTIIHNTDGSTTIIVVPRRSYLDPGTDVPVGYGSHMDYAFPPNGDPGEPYSFYGPDLNGIGGVTLARPFWLPGYNPYNPY
jgi:hypothetical protein